MRGAKIPALLLALFLSVLAALPAYPAMIGDASDVIRWQVEEGGGLQALTAKALSGDTEAMYILGGACYFGAATEQSYSEAAKWWKMGADLNDANSMLSLATLYDEGLGVPPNDALALMLYHRAAEMGQVEAQFAVGWKAEISGNYEEAAKWYRNAANGGHVTSQYNLARFYVMGRGVAQDFNEALRLFTSAAQGGHERSQEILTKLGRTW